MARQKQEKNPDVKVQLMAHIWWDGEAHQRGELLTLPLKDANYLCATNRAAGNEGDADKPKWPLKVIKAGADWQQSPMHKKRAEQREHVLALMRSPAAAALGSK